MLFLERIVYDSAKHNSETVAAATTTTVACEGSANKPEFIVRCAGGRLPFQIYTRQTLIEIFFGRQKKFIVCCPSLRLLVIGNCFRGGETIN